MKINRMSLWAEGRRRPDRCRGGNGFLVGTTRAQNRPGACRRYLPAWGRSNCSRKCTILRKASSSKAGRSTRTEISGSSPSHGLVLLSCRRQALPAFNCDPPEESAPVRAAGHALSRRQTVSDDAPYRHHRLRSQTKKFSPVGSTFRNQLFKGPNDLDFDAEGTSTSSIHGEPALGLTRRTPRSRVPVFQGRDSSAHHFDPSVPERHRGVAGK